MSKIKTTQTDVLSPPGGFTFDYRIEGPTARITARSNFSATLIQFITGELNVSGTELISSSEEAQGLLSYLGAIYPDIRRLLIFLTWSTDDLFSVENLACDPSNEWLQHIAEHCQFALHETYFKLRHPELTYAKTVVEIAASRKARPGFVYVIVAANGYCKIGKTTNPDDRLSRLQTGNPFEIRYEVLIRCDDNHAVEQALHRRFAEKNTTGEWFQLSAEDINTIKFLIRDFGNVR